MNSYKSPSSQKAFTLIELLIVIGILSILATVVLLVINPIQLIKQTRDANRLTELNQIDKALALFESFGGIDTGVSNKVYVSIPSVQSNCSDLGLPALGGGYTYACSNPTDFRKTNGSGWIPVDFTSVQSSAGSLFASLPIDPINTVANGYYYTYIKGSWALSATMESDKYIASNAANDGGQKSTRSEIGNKLDLNVNLGSDTTVITYAITYNTNGSTSGSAPTNQTKTHDIILALATNTGTLAKTGYTFAGWNTAANGSGTDYAEGANYTANAGVTLYAKWTIVCGVGDTLGIISYWKLDGDAIDYYGSNEGININSGAVSTTGKVGNALHFDGIDDYISVGDHASLDLTTEVTVIAWVKITAHKAFNFIFFKYYAYGVRDYNDNLGWTPWTPHVYRTSWYASSTYHMSSDVNNWTFHTYVYSSTSGLKYYINGSLVINASLTGNINNSSYPFTIGWSGMAGETASYLAGDIDEVAIFARVLSAAEISSLYNRSNAGLTYCQ